MSERKNIDKLFQEKFKDFEAEPPHGAWSHIEAKLKEKKDRKVIPFWWKLSGVAAALLLGLWILDGDFNQGFPDKSNSVVERSPNRKIKDSIKTIPDGNLSTADHAVTEMGSPGNKQRFANPVQNPLATDDLNGTTNNTRMIIKSKPDANLPFVVNENRNSATDKKSNAIRLSRISSPSKLISDESRESRVAAISSVNKRKEKSSNKNAERSFHKNDDIQIMATQTVPGNKSYIETSDAVTTNQNQTHPELNPSNNHLIPDIQAQSAVTAANNKLDSTAIATVAPNALEELLNEKENNLVAKEPHLNRWQITSSVAPIYFGSTSNGSPIDSTFAGNSKNYMPNLSIAVGVNYAISKKLTIRTGISHVTFNYNTNDVYISAGMQSASLANVNLSTESQFINFGKRATGNNLVSGDSELLSSDTFQSSINQKMGYIEVPLELSYTLFDERFGLNIIGGVSSLFLNENKITVVSEGLKSNLGEANNLNKTHFSSNIGLGVKYKIFKELQANFEPMFKYQINTFSKNNGNFKPYYFGLYTGLSYSF